jgi:phospholipid N-methyltransferase
MIREGGGAAGAGRLFRAEAKADFRHVGAVAPSGRPLAVALANAVAGGRSDGGRRILEVGAGTGAVTEAIAAALGPRDTLLVVERNAAFLAHLEQRLGSEATFRPCRDRIRLLHADVESLDRQTGFDGIVSSLPFNNFTGEEVRGHLRHFQELLLPGGRIAFYEYLWVRLIRVALACRAERERLRGVGQVLAEARKSSAGPSRIVWWNLPPALVHLLRGASVVPRPAAGGRVHRAS